MGNILESTIQKSRHFKNIFIPMTTQINTFIHIHDHIWSLKIQPQNQSKSKSIIEDQQSDCTINDGTIWKSIKINQNHCAIYFWLVVCLPLWKYEFVSWDHYSQYTESHKIHIPNHQLDYNRKYLTSQSPVKSIQNYNSIWTHSILQLSG